MKTYRLRIPDSIADLVRRMHPQLKRKIRYSLRLILDKPDDGNELRFELSGLRSFRVSRFRIIYRVRNKTVEIVAIGPRANIYRETLQILRKEKKA